MVRLSAGGVATGAVVDGGTVVAAGATTAWVDEGVVAGVAGWTAAEAGARVVVVGPGWVPGDGRRIGCGPERAGDLEAAGALKVTAPETAMPTATTSATVADLTASE
jgi:hypothetical protein